MQGIVWILFFYLLGCVVSALTGNFIPGSVVGMLLLFGALSAGWLRPWRMKRAAGFLLDNMMLFFIPVGVGLIASYSLVSKYLAAILVASIVSTVLVIVVVGMITDFSMTSGLFNDIIVFFGGERSPLLQNPALYRTIYVLSDIWQQVGWGSIIYLSALSGVDAQLYDAASIDGAGRFQKLLHVTLPGIMPTIITMLILRIGSLMSIGYEKTILLYNPSTYDTADIISSYVYRVGLLEQGWSYSTAIGLFNSVINLILLVLANKLSKKLADTSLW